MGVSRIHVTNLSEESERFKQFVFEVQSDSTLYELIESMNLSILNFHTNETSDPLVLYDCTLYPPKDFSEKVQEYCETTGPKSITIEALGWFPSAKLVIFRHNDKKAREYLHSSIHTDEDFEYNIPSSHGLCHETIGVKPKPSEIFQAVENRTIAHEENGRSLPIKDISTAKKRTEEERRAKINLHLERLKRSKKHDRVSTQVKKMLIKSSAKGEKKVRMEDRFYLETILLDERYPSTDHDGSEYCFFSRAGTIGHVIAARINGLNLGRNHMAELLIVLQDIENETVMRRLPTTMHLYDAIGKDILKEFDQVIVRIYDATETNATENIGVVDSNQNKEIIKSCEKVSDGHMSKEQQILKAIGDMDSKSESKAVSIKVHQLLMKGKAKGNKKIRVNDRFYFEKISVVIDSEFGAKHEFIFVDRGESINHVFPIEKECFMLKDGKLVPVDIHHSTDRVDSVIAPYSRVVSIC
jgi:hypothetical protein